MQANDYVKWTATDADGNFEHVGQIIATGLTLGFVKIRVPNVGEMIVHPDDGKMTVVAMPKDYGKQPVVKPCVTVPKPIDTQRAASSKGATKEACIELYNAMKVNGAHPSRGEVIATFEALGMSKNTASTYQYNCKSNWCK